MTTINIPEPGQIRKIPESAAMAVLEAALQGVEVTLRVQHPPPPWRYPLYGGVDDPVAPSEITAALVADRCAELRALLRTHIAAMYSDLALDPQDDLPF